MKNELRTAFTAIFTGHGSITTIEWVPMPEHFPEEAGIPTYTQDQINLMCQKLEKYNIAPYDVEALRKALEEIKQEINGE